MLIVMESVSAMSLVVVIMSLVKWQRTRDPSGIPPSPPPFSLSLLTVDSLIFSLVLNSGASKDIEWHCKHYHGRGLFKKFDSGAALAKEIGCSPATLEKTFADYRKIAETKNDPLGRKYVIPPAFFLRTSLTLPLGLSTTTNIAP